jgi:Flp pilus assembly protein TadG
MLRDCGGGPAIEFGIVAPIFLMILLGIYQFGLACSNYLFLTNAVIAGAQTLSVS